MLISKSGAALGIFSRNDALELARSKGEDLVELRPNSIPPVCQIIDFGMYQYRRRHSKKSGPAKLRQ